MVVHCVGPPDKPFECRPGAYVQVHVPAYAREPDHVEVPAGHRADWEAAGPLTRLANETPIRRAYSVAVPVEQISDFLWYFERAREIATGDGYAIDGHLTAFWPVGWPGALALLFLIALLALAFAYRVLTQHAHRYRTVTGKGFRPRIFPLGRGRPWASSSPTRPRGPSPAIASRPSNADDMTRAVRAVEQINQAGPQSKPWARL